MIYNRLLLGGVLFGLLGMWVSSVSAQERRSGPAQCHGETISRINVHAFAPFAMHVPRAVIRFTNFVTSLHATTKPRVILRFLTLRPGDPCTEFRRLESERILRAQPFLADAHITVRADTGGTVAMDVTTVDEVSLILDGTVTSQAPVVRAIHAGELNVGGEGIYTAGEWRYSDFYRDIYKARVEDYQFLGQPYQMVLQGSRDELGGSWDTELSYPFLTDLQRVSWRAAAGSSDAYQYFLRQGAPDPALRSVRAYGDVGGVYAMGSVQNLFLIGTSLSYEREGTAAAPVIVLDSGVFPDTSRALFGRYGEHHSSRVNLLLGFRHMTFMRVSGFDALEGAQDVRTGFQLATLLGRGIRVSDDDDRDEFMSGDVYVGGGSPTSFIAAELMSERRVDLDTHQWDGLLASGRAAWYLQPVPRSTIIWDAEYSGGARQRVPFQLSFANKEGGLLGYGSSSLSGGQRLVGRLNDIWRFGHFRQFAAFGGGVFINAGKLWAGDVPFGTTTEVKYSAGVSLLAAVPPQSRRTWRMDLAMPLNDQHDARFEIRFSNADLTRSFWREPGDMQSSRERSIPNSVYNWP